MVQTMGFFIPEKVFKSALKKINRLGGETFDLELEISINS